MPSLFVHFGFIESLVTVKPLTLQSLISVPALRVANEKEVNIESPSSDHLAHNVGSSNSWNTASPTEASYCFLLIDTHSYGSSGLTSVGSSVHPENTDVIF